MTSEKTFPNPFKEIHPNYEGEAIDFFDEVKDLRLYKVIGDLVYYTMYDPREYFLAKNRGRVFLETDITTANKRRMLKTFISAVDPEVPHDLNEAAKGFVEVNIKTNKDGTMRRGKVKFGRILKKFFYEVPDKEIEILVDKYKKANTPVNNDVEFSDEIVAICCKPVSLLRGGISVNTFLKSLSDSCMRYSFDHLTHHPFKSYEGEFEVAYILDDNGLLMCRTIIHKESKYYAPIYTVNMPAYDKMVKVLEEKGYNSLETNMEGWVGAKLQFIEVEAYYEEDDYTTSGYLSPYVDIIPVSEGEIDKVNRTITILGFEDVMEDQEEIHDCRMDYLGFSNYHEPDLYGSRYACLKNAEGWVEC